MSDGWRKRLGSWTRRRHRTGKGGPRCRELRFDQLEARLNPSTLISVTTHRDLVFDAAANLLYISTTAGRIERYDAAAQSLLSPLTVGTSLNGADITPDGNYLYVAENATNATQGFVHKVNLTTGAVTDLAYTRASGESGAWDVNLASNGLGFVTTQYSGSGWTPLRQIDLTTDLLSTGAGSPGSGAGGSVRQNTNIQRSTDRSRMFFEESNISSGPAFTYDTATNTFPVQDDFNTFLSSSLSAVNRSGTLIALDLDTSFSILAADLTAVRSFTGASGGLAFDPTRDILYAVNPTTDEVVAYSTSTWQEKFRLSIGEDVGSSTPLGNGVLAVGNTELFLATTQGIRVIPLPTNPGIVSRFEVSGFPTFIKGGVNETVTVAAKDNWGDVIPTYTGTVHFTSNDGAANLPADYTFSAGDAGVKSLSVTLNTVGTRSITATDTVSSGVTGTQSGITVHAAGATLIPVTNHRDLVLDESGQTLYITTTAGTVERYHLATESLRTPFSVGSTLNGADITPDGTALYIADGQSAGTQGFVRKLNLTTGAVADLAYTLAFGESGAWDVNLASNGRGFVTTQYSGSGWTPLRQIDLTTDILSTRAGSPGSGAGGSVRQNTNIQRSTDRSRMFFEESNISSGPAFTYDTATNTFPVQDDFNTFLSSSLSAVNRSGTLIALDLDTSFSILAADLTAVRSFTGASGGLAFDPTRDILYAVNPTTDEVVAYSTSTWQEKFRLSIGEDVGSSTPLGNGVLAVGNTELFLATTQGIRVIPLPTNPGIVSRFEVSGFPTFIKGGVNETVTVAAKDNWGDVIPTYTGTVHFTSNDGAANLPADYTFSAGDAGVKSLSVTLNTVGTRSITATDTVSSGVTGTQSGITVHAAGATLIPVTNHRDLVLDESGQTLYITTTAGTVERYHLATESLRTPFSVGSTLNGADITPDGTALYIADGQSAGTQGFVRKLNLTTGAVADLAYTLAFGESGAWDVNLASNGRGFVTTQYSGSGWTPLRQIDLTTDLLSTRADMPGGVRQNTHIQRSADRSRMFFEESNISSGPAFTYDTATNTFPVQADFETFLSSSLSAVNRDGTLIAVDLGSTVAVLTANLTTVRSLTGVDGGLAFDPTRDILYTVNSTTNEVVAYSTSTWKEKFRLSIGEDVGASTPLGNGVLTVADTQLFLATAQGVRVIPLPTNPGIVSRLEVADFPTFIKAGAGGTVTVTAKDSWGDVIPGYAGTVHFTSTDGAASLPSDYTFTVADGGTKSFPVTLNTAGTRNITSTDTAVPAITGSQSNITVHAPGVTLIPVANRRDLVFDAARQTLYITTSSGSVERYHLPTEALLTPFNIGSSLYGADISPDGNWLYVAESTTGGTQGFVHKLNLTTGAVTELAYTLAGGEIGAWDVAIAGNGLGFFTTQYGGSGWVSLHKFDLATDAMLPTGIGVRQNTHVQRSADRSLLFFQESNTSSGPIFVYEAALNQITQTLDTDVFQDTAMSAVNRNGTVIAHETTTLNIRDQNLNSVTTLSNADGGVAFDPQRDVLFAVNSSADTVRVYNSTWSQLFQVSIGQNVSTSTPFSDGVMTTSADASKVFLSTSTGVRIIDIPTLSISIAPNSFSENGGTATGTVVRTGSLTSAMTVSLSSSDPSEATVPASVVIPANQASVTFAITAVDDTLSDGTQLVTITALGTNILYGSQTLSVTDNEALILSFGAGSIAENGGSTMGTVTRSNTDISAAVVVNLSNDAPTAVTVPATVTIPANQASATFPVTAVDDTLLDGTQTATITASASGYANGAQTINVTDVETLTLTLDLAAIGENGGSATGTVTRSNTDRSAPLVVNLANSDTTEASVPVSVTIPANQASVTFAVAALDDDLLDGTRTVTLTASATGYLNGTQAIDVADYETLTVLLDSSTISENGGSAVGTVTRSNADNSAALVVNLANSNSTAATFSASVTIPANQASVTFAVTAVDDTLLDGTQTTTITATANGYVSGSQSLDVTDDETLIVTINPASISENGGTATGTVTRTNTDRSAALLVNLVSSQTTGAAVPASVTIPANQSSVTFPITAVDDVLVDGTQTVTVTASATGYGDGTRTLDVTDYEILTVTINLAAISEFGGSATGTVSRGNTDPSTALVVNLTSSDTTEATVPATVTIPANESAVSFTITAVDDALFDGTRTATITASASGYINGGQSLDVTDLETLTVTIDSTSISESGGSALGTVTRSNTDTASPLVVNLANSDPTEVAVPATVTIPANQNSATFVIAAVDDTQVDGPAAVTIAASSAGYVDDTRTLDVTDYEPLSVTVDLSAISESNGSATGTVSRGSTDNGAALVVTLTSSDTTEATVPASVTIPANQSSATFPITAVDDTLLDGTRTATITASASGYVDGVRTIDVTDLETLTVTIDLASISENAGSATGTVTRSNTDSAALSLNLASSDTSEAAVPTSVTIPANQLSTTFPITGVDDALLDGTLAATVTASAAGYVSGMQMIDVTDYETLTVTVGLASISEADGSTTGTVTRSNTDNSAALVVNLASSDTSAATTPSTVTIPANQSSATFSITAVDDTLLDGTQVATITATASSYVSGNRTIDVTDLETLTVTVDLPAINENGGSATATVTRSNTDNAAALVVNLSSNDASEASVAATVTIPANQASTTFSVTAVDDMLLDGTRTATITASAGGYVNGTRSLDVTDYEDLTVTINLSAISESGGSATGTVTRSNTDHSIALVVNLASNDTTEASVPASITIPANQASATFPITALDDALLDGTRTATVTASATGYVSGNQSIDITDLETLTVNITPLSVSENNGSATGTVTRSNADNSTALLVNLTSDDATEAITPAIVTIPANQSSVTFAVTAVDDTLLDGTRTAIITASAGGYADGARSVDVTDFEFLTITIDLTSISEDGGSATGTVMRSNSDHSAALVVSLASNDATEATVPSSVTIPANQSTVQFPITAVDDFLLDGTRTVTLTASASGYVNGTRTIDVTDLEALTVTVNLATISEFGGSATGTVTRSNTDNSAALVVNLSSSNTGEATVPASVTMAANQASATFPIAAVDDALLDGTQSVTITGSAGGYVNGSRALDVTDFETLTVTIDRTAISESGGSATGTVTRSNTDSSAALVVNLMSSDTTEATVPASVTIPANQVSVTFPIAGVDDALLDGTRTATITGSSPDYVSGNRSLDITDRETLTVSINAASMSENGGSTTATVTRSNTDNTAALVVALSSSDASEAGVPPTVTIAANQGSASFAITGVDDNLLDGLQTATITATATNYVGGSQTIDITDLETLTVTTNLASVSENGGSATGTVTRSNTDNAAALVVNLVSSDTSEAAVPASVTIPANQSAMTFLITAVDDTLLDGTRTATITASAGGYVNGTRSLDVTDYEDLTVTLELPSISESGGSTVGTVTRSNTDNSAPLVVTLVSNDTTEATVPASVTIPANENSASFLVTATDDSLLDGTRTTTVTATASGYQAGLRAIDVTDWETLTVTVNLSEISESGSGTTGTVTRNNSDIATALVVSLSSSDTSEVTVPALVTIPANQTTAAFPINALDDVLLDGTQAATITATASGYVSGSRSINVTDFESVTVAFELSSITENGGSATGTVTRSNTDKSAPLIVNLMSSDTTEVTVPASVTIPANQSAVTFTATAVDDLLLDGLQTAAITATADGYFNGSRSINVLDHETMAITIDRPSISEFGGSATGTVTRSNSDNAAALVVNLSSSDTSEASVPATVIIPMHQSSATFPITAVDDTLLDGTQTVILTATSVAYVGGTQTLDVTDFEVLTVTINLSSISENGGTATGTVQRSNTDNSAALIVGLATNDPTEVTIPTSVAIPANQNLVTFSISALNDALLDGSQAVVISAAAAGYVAGNVNLNVLDDEALAVTIDLPAMAENGGSAVGTVTRSNLDDLSQPLVVTLTSSDISEAVVPPSVTIGAGSASATFDIDARDDNLLDGTVTVTVSAAATGYVSGTGQLAVADHETLLLSFSAGQISEQGGVTTATVRRSDTDDLSSPLTVTLTNDDPAEATVPPSVTIAAGEDSVTFNVAGVDDAILDGAQTTAIRATATGFVSATGTLEVTDHELLVVEWDVASVSEFNGQAVLTVRRTDTDSLSQPLVVTLTNPDPSELEIPSLVTIPAGSSSTVVSVNSVDDRLFDGPQTVEVMASAAGYLDGQAALAVTDHETLTVSLGITSISELNGVAIATVTRGNTDDLTLPLIIQLTSSDVSEAAVPTTVTIPAQSAAAQFAVTASDDALLDGTQAVSLTAMAAGYVSVSGMLEVTDFETLSVTVVAATISENGGTSQATVTRGSTNNASPLTVMLTSSDTSEATVPTSVTIPANQASATFTITATDDALLDGTQVVSIGAAATGYVGGADSLDVTDHEALSLVLDAASLSERGGVTTGTVTRSNTSDLSQALVVSLASSDTSEAVVPATVTIAANQSAASFLISAADDDLLDGSQSVTISATHAQYASAGSATLQVSDFETLGLALDLAAISEFNGSATGTVTRSNLGDLSQPLIVTLGSSDTSEARVPASVTIPANSSSATFLLIAMDDALLDGTQAVTINASAAGFVSQAVPLDVTDHETLSLTLAPATISEFNGSATATVTRNNSDLSQPLTVQLSSNDTTEATVPPTVTIPALEASVTFTISAVDDNLLDGTQSATIAASAVGYVGSSASLDVTDHEALALSFNLSSLSEQGGQTTGTVTRGNADMEAALTVQLAGGDASEIQLPASVTIGAGQTSATFGVLAIDDALLDGSQSATVSAEATGYVSASSTLTITDYEALNLSVESNTISEFAGVTSVTVSRSNSDVTSALVVTLINGDSTELSLPVSVNIPAGATSRTVTVTSVDDALLDGTQSVTMTATAAGYVSGTATVGVTDFELLTLTTAAIEFPENGGAAMVTVTRSNSDIGQPLVVQLSSDDPSQLTVPSSVTVPANQSAATVSVLPVDDDLLDGLQTVRISAAAGGYQNGSIQLRVADAETLALSLAAGSISEQDGSTTATVTRGNSDLDTDLTVTIQLADTSEAAAPTTVVIPAGQASAEFAIDARDDDLLDGPQAVSVNVSAGGYQPGQAILNVTDHETLTITLLSSSISEAAGLTNATVTRSNTDRSTALVVTLTSADISEANVPATVTIPAGQASATFGISGVDDQLADGSQSVTITAEADGYGSGAATMVVTDQESLSLAITPTTISEAGGLAVGTVTRLNANVDQPLTVQVRSHDVSEALVPSTVTIPAGQASVTFDITAVDDAVLDGTQSVQIEVAATDYSASLRTLSVTDHETLELTLASNQVLENSGELTASVSRSDGNVAAPLIVRLSSSRAGRVVLPSTIVIPGGAAASSPFTITVLDNSTLDGDVELTLTASAAGYENGVAPLTIVDLEPLILVLGQTSISELDGTTTATVRRPAASAEALTVQLSSEDESKAAFPATVTIAAGQQQSSPFTITAVDDDVLQGPQSITIRAAAAGYVDATQSLNILDHEALGLTIDVSAVSERNGSATATVTRGNSDLDQPLTVTLVSSDAGAGTVPATVVIPANSSAATFEIVSVDNDLLDGERSIEVTASAVGYVPADSTLAVLDYETLSIELTISAVAESDGAVSATVRRHNTNLDQPLTVTLQSGDESEVTVPASVSIPAGQVSATFLITPVDDSIVDGTQTVPVRAEATGYVPAEATLDVSDPASSWHNARLGLDVNEDDAVSPLDALIVINEMNAKGSYQLPTGSGGPPYLDVNADGFVSPLDALLVINFLNNGGGAEGESSVRDVVTSVLQPVWHDQTHDSVTMPSANPARVLKTGTPQANLSSALVAPGGLTPESIDRAWSEPAELDKLDAELEELLELLVGA